MRKIIIILLFLGINYSSPMQDKELSSYNYDIRPQEGQELFLNDYNDKFYSWMGKFKEKYYKDLALNTNILYSENPQQCFDRCYLFLMNTRVPPFLKGDKYAYSKIPSQAFKAIYLLLKIYNKHFCTSETYYANERIESLQKIKDVLTRFDWMPEIEKMYHDLSNSREPLEFPSNTQFTELQKAIRKNYFEEKTTSKKK